MLRSHLPPVLVLFLLLHASFLLFYDVYLDMKFYFSTNKNYSSQFKKRKQRKTIHRSSKNEKKNYSSNRSIMDACKSNVGKE